MGNWHKETIQQLQNLALGLKWITEPIVAPKLLRVPKSDRRETRAITTEEHEAIVASAREAIELGRPNAKHGNERANYYELLYHTGAAQTDGASLTHENVDREAGELSFHRSKTGERCAIKIAGALEELLKRLPENGPLFPSIRCLESKHRAAEFNRMRKKLGLSVITLHSYRYHMAE